MEKLDHSNIASGNVNWCNYSGKVWQFLKESKYATNHMLCNCTPRHLPQRNENDVCTKTCTPMFIAALFTKAKNWKQPRCPSTSEQLNCGTIIHGILLSNKKEQPIGTCNNLGEAPENCAE